ncbi:bifunctional [glutamate--ammonia ligase]-adenylyl-L-tyrosine phosphorylase/[glutamate--ammonia-ligase] adenylyltransferase [Aliidiomarina iranensis]|uniref:Bifunctional glutamine synthetase adenylyltransferase/adenylyl-removing enzyme n=1 Tax=Aliidiomarina iranensis TaxID=1434071 RepID=A0A432VU49_9GAMM|nr:bifunctional [glutamate--ammonia ligase]-adenylyl-L-tyrosine phosphorylase/[glutamate--ammonia-ligase] adenylyltransferase [Aliidiomarina iranensis]RUO20005.1 bifunctional [glutamate--ammonia ligase]-adenylyl-L-tyrosine phosphorylase/[glutamate--ammonia-ligase] adenylyltransferase [Aliidiomarina iranensis]
MLQLPVPPQKPEDYSLHPLIEEDSLDIHQQVQTLLANLENLSFTAEQEAKLYWLVQVSPFVGRVVCRYKEAALLRIFTPMAADSLVIQEKLESAENEQTAMAEVRKFRNIEMARIASLDLLGELALGRMLQENSALADMLITSGINYVSKQLEPRYGMARGVDGASLPLIVLAMGKLGGSELNFSSDIDLIFAYPNAGETQGGRQNIDYSMYYNKLGQGLIKLLDQPTIDGRAFRIDMRLRPFGQSGALVSSLSALEDYYHEQGRMWERYAMIKARVLNTDSAMAQQVQQMLRPFIYRRYLDYSAIDALRKMKLLINQEARRQGVAENIKLGLGGIREVEFVAQVFQLIRGGREQEFQTTSLLSALTACARHGTLSEKAIENLLSGYAYLRKLEHIIQELNDEQTQQLPPDELTRMRVLAAAGFAQNEAGWQKFIALTQEKMLLIHQEFLEVIGGEEDMLAGDESEYAILWQDLLADDTALDILREAKAAEPEACWQVIQDFRMLLRKRPSGPRGRELQGRLIPALIESALKETNSHLILQRTFEVLAQISSRTTYLELLCQNEAAREQLLFLCGASPWIAHLIAKFPLLLDELIDPVQLYELPDVESYRSRVSEYLMRLPNDDAEAQMDALRQVKQIFQMKVAAADLNAGVHLMRVSDHLTYLAEAMIEQVVSLAWKQLCERHGAPPGRDESDTGFAVIAYGKLGGYELGYGSDLDLVFVSDDQIGGDTQGAKPIPVQQFYLRLAQRVLHLFTTRTMSGVLFDVDMRLRPSGQAGLMVVRMSTYQEYLQKDAWTWELQALVRARMVYGATYLRDRFASVRTETLCTAREADKLRSDILQMRKKMRDHLCQTHKQKIDIKQAPGGITDIEFITQYLVLKYALKHPDLAIWTDNIRILEIATRLQLISQTEADALIFAYQDYRAEIHRLALAEAGRLSERDFSQHLGAVQEVWQRLFADNQ